MAAFCGKRVITDVYLMFVCEQAEAVVDMIGFPQYIINATQLDERYVEVCFVQLHTDVKKI
jgi:3-deoxy-D-manno-octulosonic acid (KDO) 8-phosphate synthase